MKQLLFTIALLMSSLMPSMAQCKFQNTAFKSGEFLTYNLYFNWKFVWVKVGNATMSTVENHYHGKPAYKASLITRTSSKADKFFIMRDTLLCYNTLDLEPLYFRKGAQEGKRYTVDGHSSAIHPTRCTSSSTDCATTASTSIRSGHATTAPTTC